MSPARGQRGTGLRHLHPPVAAAPPGILQRHDALGAQICEGGTDAIVDGLLLPRGLVGETLLLQRLHEAPCRSRNLHAGVFEEAFLEHLGDVVDRVVGGPHPALRPTHTFLHLLELVRTLGRGQQRLHDLLLVGRLPSFGGNLRGGSRRGRRFRGRLGRPAGASTERTRVELENELGDLLLPGTDLGRRLGRFPAQGEEGLGEVDLDLAPLRRRTRDRVASSPDRQELGDLAVLQVDATVPRLEPAYEVDQGIRHHTVREGQIEASVAVPEDPNPQRHRHVGLVEFRVRLEAVEERLGLGLTGSDPPLKKRRLERVPVDRRGWLGLRGGRRWDVWRRRPFLAATGPTPDDPEHDQRDDGDQDNSDVHARPPGE